MEMEKIIVTMLVNGTVIFVRTIENELPGMLIQYIDGGVMIREMQKIMYPEKADIQLRFEIR